MSTAQHVSSLVFPPENSRLLNLELTDHPLKMSVAETCCSDSLQLALVVLLYFWQLQYRRGPVEALQGLWEQVNGSGDTAPPWDLTLNTLRQVHSSTKSRPGEHYKYSAFHAGGS